MDNERAICEVMSRFATGIDVRDWAMYRSAFVDEITFDYTSYRPGSHGTVSADDWVERGRRRFEALDATQHTLTSPIVTSDHDAGSCSVQVNAWHVVEVDGQAQECTIVGRYVNDMARVDGQWRIRVVRLQVRWISGNRAILDL